ncbi:hypothetical protein DXG01_005822 [Tephrocybe rancida]|nr:hypothetical protein DXG01_005822 [Tephrocybe rancida]
MATEVNELELLAEFRARFHSFHASIQDAITNSADPIVLQRLGDDLQQYSGLVNEHAHIFSPEELNLIQLNLGIMQNDVQHQYQQTVNESHHGLGRSVVRRHLLALGISEGQQQPFVLTSAYIDAANSVDALDLSDDLLDPPLEEIFPGDGPPMHTTHGDDVVVTSYTGPLSTISNEELDELLLRLRGHFRRAGITILDGMVRWLGHRIPRQRIRESLTRIDPVRRVFECIRIRRRVYNVPGPNSLWHHDGQHAWMEENMGQGCGSYLWGRSVHNVRIEQLWVDVTAQIGATWADLFTTLEIQYGLDINNINHIWLLQHLFLPTINEQLTFFVESWNHHRIQIHGGPNHSPADMFGFDMFVHGVRGSQLPQEEEPLSIEELEVLGVDWEGVRNDQLLHSLEANNSRHEPAGSWIGHSGPPEHLNEVRVEEPPNGIFTKDELHYLDLTLSPFMRSSHDSDVIALWTWGLGLARAFRPDLFG